MAETIFFEASQHTIFLDRAAQLLAVAAGLVLPRWQRAFVVGAVLGAEFAILDLALPALAFGEPFPWAGLEYGVFWAGLAIWYARWLLIFGAVFAARRLTQFGLRRLQSRAGG